VEPAPPVAVAHRIHCSKEALEDIQGAEHRDIFTNKSIGKISKVQPAPAAAVEHREVCKTQFT